MGGKESDKIKQASDELSRVLQKIGTEIYQKVTASQKTGAGKPEEATADPSPSSKGDNVVDAEFKEVKDEASG